MDFNAVLSSPDRARVEAQIDSFNKTLSPGREIKQSLDKDDFLKILITQLRHQDPTAPMEDREFIAQMAQFSTLEQMTNMSKDFSALAGMLGRGNALNLLGKTVEVVNGDQVVTGVVNEIVGREFPRINVEGGYYDLDQVERVINE